VYEIEQDGLMKRTQRRPLPSGLLTRRHALAFAGVSAAVGLGCLYLQTNTTATLLGAANIGLYACIYTPLKQVSVVNTWVGALVGAVPPLMGCGLTLIPPLTSFRAAS
jgi:protoheme IX farnesyltransferase